MSPLKRGLLKVAADILCLFIFGLPLWIYNLLEVVPLTRLGYFCSDNGIRYPYRESTVSSPVMMVTGFGLILLCGLVVESCLYRKYGRTATNTPFHPWLVSIYRVIGYFVIGAAINQFLTDVVKLSVGRLRPHFLDVCQPNVICTAENQHVYIHNYTCLMTSHPVIPQNMIHKRLMDSRKSFPSGHASFSTYAAIFVIIYLEYRVRSQYTRICRHIFQAGTMAWALWVCSSRIYDFKHRFSDVAAGMILGTAVSVFTAYIYIRSTQSTARRLQSRPHPESNTCCYCSKTEQTVTAASNGYASTKVEHMNTSLTQLNEIPNDSHNT